MEILRSLAQVDERETRPDLRGSVINRFVDPSIGTKCGVILSKACEWLIIWSRISSARSISFVVVIAGER